MKYRAVIAVPIAMLAIFLAALAQSLCKLRTGGIAPRSMRLCADTKKTGNAAPKPDRPPHHHARVPNLGEG